MNPSLEDLESKPQPGSQKDAMNGGLIKGSRCHPLVFLMLPAFLLGMATAYIAFGRGAAADEGSAAGNAEKGEVGTLAELESRLVEQTIRVHEVRGRMQDLAKKQIILSSSPRMKYSKTREDAYRQTVQNIDDLEQEIETLRAQMDMLPQLLGGEIVRSQLLYNILTPTIREVYPRYVDLTLDEAQAQQSGIGRQHPQLLEIRNQLEITKALLVDEVDDVHDSLAAKLKIAESRLDIARKEFEEMKVNEAGDNLKYAAYQQVREEYYEQLNILMDMTRELVEKKKALESEAAAQTGEY